MAINLPRTHWQLSQVKDVSLLSMERNQTRIFHEKLLLKQILSIYNQEKEFMNK